MQPVLLTKPPSKLGRFEVGAKIGGGGMATVYLGRHVHEDGVEQLVALKVMREELAHDEQFIAMFVDEAKILARLSHPNVIQTLEFGVEDHSFIAMELLNGRTVSDAYEAMKGTGDKFDFGTAAWICARVAEGLHSAHELVDEDGQPLSVIHRDVNPTNIFLTYSGEVKLIDFGLARARVRMSKSAEGIVKGKIPYLAPEQAQGRTIDRRIDIYALGTTLWEMVSMKRLFKRDNDVDTLRAIQKAEVPDLRKEIPDFPEALWKVIDLALKIDRDERYATAEEMRTDLDAFARTTGPHGPRVAALVSKLFPGAEARQAEWLHDAAASREGTMRPPPAPVPIASSSMLDADARKFPPSQRNPTIDEAPISKVDVSPKNDETPPPSSVAPDEEPSAPISKRPPSVRPPSRRSVKPAPPSGESPKAEATPKKSVPPARKSDPGVSKDERRTKLKRTGKAKKPSVATAPPPEDKKKLWLIVGGAVLLLLLLAILASR